MSTGDIYLNVGGKTILIPPFGITPRKSIQLNEKITQARIIASPFSKLPPEQDEKREDWVKRYNEFIAEEEKQKKEESAKAFLERTFDSTAFKDNLDYLFACVEAIAEVFGHKDKVDKESLQDTPMIAINNFIARVCQKAKVPCGLTIDTEFISADEF